MKKIVMTGGGTAGHVMVNRVLIPRLIQMGWEVSYIGGRGGVEEQMIGQLEGVTYYGITTGKLRRYFSVENFKDIFRVLKGVGEAYKMIGKIEAQLVFSCGGFVAVPVVIAGWLRRIPIIVRETDYTVGLANKVSMPFADKICVTFPDTLKNELSNIKRVECGPIIREELLRGNKLEALEMTLLKGEKPVLLIVGGSQGAQKINEVVGKCLDELLEKFEVVHLCGKGKMEGIKKEGYVQFEYVEEGMSHLYALADLVITRAGSNAVVEGMLLNKPMLLIPLSKKVSRGDQLLNARYVERQGKGKVILEEELTEKTFINQISSLYENRTKYIRTYDKEQPYHNLEKQLEILKQISKR